ncbi:MAG: hypothetical protein J0I07_22305 [Myxococcales bacterium]|nr:hypothetical protein [Myxococcales bacterium]
MFAALLGPLSGAVLAGSGCAVSNDPNGAAIEPDGGIVIPMSDSGDEASLADAGADAIEGDSLSLPCAAGRVCRVETPLTIGSVASLSGRSKDDVWASASRGGVMRWDGRQWAALESTITETLSSLYLTADETWGVGGVLALRRRIDGSSVKTVQASIYTLTLSGIAVLANGDIYLSYMQPYLSGVTAPGVLAKLMSFDAPLMIEFAPDPVLAATNQAKQLPFRALFHVPDEALWLVGDNAAIARYPISPSLGTGVVMPVASQADLFAAWGQGDQLWAAGSGGTILHFDGTDWNEEETGTRATLRAIFGFAPNDVWAAGDEGTVLHFDGERWSKIEMGNYRRPLRAIWGAAPDDVWFGGELGMFHWGALP